MYMNYTLNLPFFLIMKLQKIRIDNTVCVGVGGWLLMSQNSTFRNSSNLYLANRSTQQKVGVTLVVLVRIFLFYLRTEKCRTNFRIFFTLTARTDAQDPCTEYKWATYSLVTHIVKRKVFLTGTDGASFMKLYMER